MSETTVDRSFVARQLALALVWRLDLTRWTFEIDVRNMDHVVVTFRYRGAGQRPRRTSFGLTGLSYWDAWESNRLESVVREWAKELEASDYANWKTGIADNQHTEQEQTP